MHTVLYSFTGGPDGGEPYKGVALDAAGNLYGTAVTGGSGSCEGGCGVTYKLAKSGSTYTQSVIHAFTGGVDGSGRGKGGDRQQGNVYGMTPTAEQTVWELSMPCIPSRMAVGQQKSYTLSLRGRWFIRFCR